MKRANFETDGKKYQMAYDCPEKEISDQINEIFSEEHYKLARRKKDIVVLDIGANVGMFSLYIKDFAKKIYAIEPSRRCFDCLKLNTKDWDNIEIFNVGFSNHIGRDVMYSKNSEAPPQTYMEEGPIKEMTQITTIEQFFKDNKLDHIDVVKMDVEGMEYIILPDQSFRSVADKIDFIIGESHYMNLAMPEHALLMLERAGFKAKLLPLKNYALWINYENSFTGQQEKYEIKKNSLFIGEK